MRCRGCGGPVVQDQWGEWCDTCGGVVSSRNADGEVRLLYRHVATVDGAGGRFAIVYDTSTASYGVMWPKEDALVKCIHCGQKTPGDIRSGLMQLDEIRPSRYCSERGSLDAMLALIQPVARRGSDDLPSLSVAPTATPTERDEVLGA